MDLQIFQNIYLTPTSISVWLNMFLVLVLWCVLKYAHASKFTVLFELGYEKMYDFFRDIMGDSEKLWVVTFVISLFFIILFFNIQSVILEFIAPILWIDQNGKFYLEQHILPASSDINFNIWMAIISIFVLVCVQFQSLWITHFFKSYFPLTGNDYVTVERWEKNIFLFIICYIPVKAFDIAISLFLWLLELVWLGAKIISLAFRLFGNMTSGAVLLGMSIVAISGMTQDWFGFSFPVVLPVIIYMQELLIGWIQALVFALLVAIFIKVARVS